MMRCQQKIMIFLGIGKTDLGIALQYSAQGGCAATRCAYEKNAELNMPAPAGGTSLHFRQARLSLLVVADTANLVADLRVVGSLLERLVGARTRPPVCNLLDRSFGGLLHYLFTERIALFAL